jgi:hypothetical protein
VIFELFIGGVDGETNVTMSASRLRSVREFLAQRDHEGSGVTLRVTAESGDEAYAVVSALEAQGAGVAVRFN